MKLTLLGGSLSVTTEAVLGREALVLSSVCTKFKVEKGEQCQRWKGEGEAGRAGLTRLQGKTVLASLAAVIALGLALASSGSLVTGSLTGSLVAHVGLSSRYQG